MADSASKSARQPKQGRSQERMEKVQKAAEELLLAVGPDAASIPEIAKLSGITRASIYQFFPDKYSLFSQLAVNHMNSISQLLQSHGSSGHNQSQDWRNSLKSAIRIISDYYRANPVACILLMRGHFTQADREAHVAKDTAFGELLRTLLVKQGYSGHLPTHPDAATIAIEITFSVMKFGFAQEGTITQAIEEEAGRACIAYLNVFE